MENKKVSKTLVVCGILSLIFFLAYAGLFAGLGFVSYSPFMDKWVKEIHLGEDLVNLKNFIDFPNLLNWGKDWFDKLSIPFGFVGFCVSAAFALFGIVALVSGIIVGAKHHRGCTVPGIFAGIFTVVPAVVLTLGASFYSKEVSLIFDEFGKYLLVGIMFIGMFLSAVLYWIFAIITYASGIRNACSESEEFEEEFVDDEEVGDDLLVEPVEEEPALVLADEAPVEEVEELPVEEESVEEPVEEEPAEPVEEEPAAPVEEEPAAPVEEKQPEADFKDMLREVIRDIVRDELAAHRSQSEGVHEHTSTITGATFGGPLIVQYFNGTNNPSEAKAVAQPAPVAPTIVEPAPVAPAPVAEPVASEPAAEQPAVEVKEKEPIIRVPFPERIVKLDKDLQSKYNTLKNEILSWGVKSRVSNTCDTFRLHRKTYIKLVVAGKNLKLYFALDPNDYKDSKFPLGDASEKSSYEEIPLIFKVKSDLSLRRAITLIKDCMEKDGLKQKEVLSINWVKELKASLKK